VELLNILIAEKETNLGSMLAAGALLIWLAYLWGKEPKSTGPRWPPTKRPLNSCGNCGHEWYPRGHDESPKCPNCGIRNRPPDS
jgi:hypothetical protein